MLNQDKCFNAAIFLSCGRRRFAQICSSEWGFLHTLNYRPNTLSLLLHVQYLESCCSPATLVTLSSSHGLLPEAGWQAAYGIPIAYTLSYCIPFSCTKMLLVMRNLQRSFINQTINGVPTYWSLWGFWNTIWDSAVRISRLWPSTEQHHLWEVMNVVCHNHLGQTPLPDCPQSVVSVESQVGGGKIVSQENWGHPGHRSSWTQVILVE